MITPHRHTVRDWLAFVVLTLAVVLVASLLAAWQVRAAECLPWQDALAAALAQYGEMPAFIAATRGGGVLTITLNPETGSWTAWVQPDAARMCVASSGGSWVVAPESVRDAVPRPGTPL